MTAATHEPIHQTKVARGYVTDDGREVPSHTLHTFDCSCGHKGPAWYAGEERARRSFERHVERVAA